MHNRKQEQIQYLLKIVRRIKADPDSKINLAHALIKHRIAFQDLHYHVFSDEAELAEVHIAFKVGLSAFDNERRQLHNYHRFIRNNDANSFFEGEFALLTAKGLIQMLMVKNVGLLLSIFQRLCDETMEELYAIHI